MKPPQHSSLVRFSRPAYEVVALGASLGGLKVINEILSALPANFPAAIVVVQHLSPCYPSHMAGLLNRSTALSVKQAMPKDLLRSGTVYVAPPNHHLLVNPDSTLALSQSERVNFVRPSVDVLFESVAASLKERAIGVVLTGRGWDGRQGVRAVRAMGGVVLAQNGATCAAADMPENAIDTGCVDLVLSPNQISFALKTLVMSASSAQEHSIAL